MKTDEKLTAALLKLAKTSGQTTTQVAQNYLSALEEPALRILCSILEGNPEVHRETAAKFAWDTIEFFAAEKMNRGEALIRALEAAKNPGPSFEQ